MWGGDVLYSTVFGERDNKIIHIDDIIPSENGVKCNCVCPACGEKLVARTLGNKNKKCFAHKANSNCDGGIETAMHKFAKEIIENEKKIKIPKLIYNKYSKEFEIVKEQLIVFDKIELERYLSDFDFKPDIIISKNDTPLIIEVAVTHKVDEEKRNKIIKSDISTIEIYLDKNEIFLLSKEELVHKIINDTDNKRWIFNRLEESQKKNIDEMADMFYQKRTKKTFDDMLSAKESPKRTKKTLIEIQQELELNRLQFKYRVDVRNLPYILRSSKNDLLVFRYYAIKTYWKLLVWDIFINNEYRKVITVDDVVSWFHNKDRYNQDLSNLTNAITEFFKELCSKKILILFNQVQAKYQINPKNLNIFRDILKEIKWTKHTGTWNGMVYKCPISSLEDHDLRLEDIKTCEKCKYFNGYVFDDGRKKSIKCRGR